MSNHKVIIRGAVYEYADKAPFVPSGKSVHGAIEMRSDGRVKCHECGRYFASVGAHIGQGVHQISPREYKLRHGLRLQSGLCSPEVGRSYVTSSAVHLAQYRGRGHVQQLGPRRRNAELLNQNGKCKAQLGEKIKQIAAELGRTPKLSELRSNGANPYRTIANLGLDGVAGLLRDYGIEPSNFQKYQHKYDASILVELLRDAKVALGRIPKSDDCRPPLLPAWNTFSRTFGSWMAALEAAGLCTERREEILSARRNGARKMTEQRMRAQEMKAEESANTK